MAIKTNNTLYGYEHVITWESNASGVATEAFGKLLEGRKLKSIKTVPDAGVSSYSITLTDDNNLDWLTGEGASRSTADAEIFYSYTDVNLPADQDLTLNISGAGNTQSGTIYLKVE